MCFAWENGKKLSFEETFVNTIKTKLQEETFLMFYYLSVCNLCHFCKTILRFL